LLAADPVALQPERAALLVQMDPGRWIAFPRHERGIDLEAVALDAAAASLVLLAPIERSMHCWSIWTTRTVIVMWLGEVSFEGVLELGEVVSSRGRAADPDAVWYDLKWV
jgi:hypothetical protein